MGRCNRLAHACRPRWNAANLIASLRQLQAHTYVLGRESVVKKGIIQPPPRLITVKAAQTAPWLPHIDQSDPKPIAPIQQNTGIQITEIHGVRNIMKQARRPGRQDGPAGTWACLSVIKCLHGGGRAAGRPLQWGRSLIAAEVELVKACRWAPFRRHGIPSKKFQWAGRPVGPPEIMPVL